MGHVRCHGVLVFLIVLVTTTVSMPRASPMVSLLNNRNSMDEHIKRVIRSDEDIAGYDIASIIVGKEETGSNLPSTDSGEAKRSFKFKNITTTVPMLSFIVNLTSGEELRMTLGKMSDDLSGTRVMEVREDGRVMEISPQLSDCLYSGPLEGEQGFATISICHGQLAGTISTRARDYQLRPLPHSLLSLSAGFPSDNADVQSLLKIADDAGVKSLLTIADDADVKSLLKFADDADVKSVLKFADDADVQSLLKFADDADVKSLLKFADDADVKSLLKFADDADVQSLLKIADDADIKSLLKIADDADVKSLLKFADDADVADVKSLLKFADDADVQSLLKIADDADVKSLLKIADDTDVQSLLKIAEDANVQSLLKFADDTHSNNKRLLKFSDDSKIQSLLKFADDADVQSLSKFADSAAVKSLLKIANIQSLLKIAGDDRSYAKRLLKISGDPDVQSLLKFADDANVQSLLKLANDEDIQSLLKVVGDDRSDAKRLLKISGDPNVKSLSKLADDADVKSLLKFADDADIKSLLKFANDADVKSLLKIVGNDRSGGKRLLKFSDDSPKSLLKISGISLNPYDQSLLKVSGDQKTASIQSLLKLADDDVTLRSLTADKRSFKKAGGDVTKVLVTWSDNDEEDDDIYDWMKIFEDNLVEVDDDGEEKRSVANRQARVELMNYADRYFIEDLRTKFDVTKDSDITQLILSKWQNVQRVLKSKKETLGWDIDIDVKEIVLMRSDPSYYKPEDLEKIGQRMNKICAGTTKQNTDMVVLHTGQTSDKGRMGLSWIGGVCRPRYRCLAARSSHYGFGTEIHEFGHSLGLKHDYQMGGCTEEGSKGFMSGSEEKAKTCYKVVLDTSLTSSKKSCLFN